MKFDLNLWLWVTALLGVIFLCIGWFDKTPFGIVENFGGTLFGGLGSIFLFSCFCLLSYGMIKRYKEELNEPST